MSANTFFRASLSTSNLFARPAQQHSEQSIDALGKCVAASIQNIQHQLEAHFPWSFDKDRIYSFYFEVQRKCAIKDQADGYIAQMLKFAINEIEGLLKKFPQTDPNTLIAAVIHAFPQAATDARIQTVMQRLATALESHYNLSPDKENIALIG